MKNCNSVCTPIEYGLRLVKDNGEKKVNATLYKQIVGSLMYLTSIRPNIIINIYMERPTENHLLTAKGFSFTCKVQLILEHYTKGG